MTPAYRAALVGLLAVVALLLAAPLAYASGEIRHEVLEPYENGYLSEWVVSGAPSAWEAVKHTAQGSSYIDTSTKGKVQVIRLGKEGTEWAYKPGWTIKKVTVKFISITAKTDGAEATAFTDIGGKEYLPDSASPETRSLQSATGWGHQEQVDWEEGKTAYPFQVSFTQLKTGSTKVYAVWAEVEVEAPEAEPKFTVLKEQRVEGASSYTAAKLEAEVGETLEYKITVTNTGGTSLTFGSLKDGQCTAILPSGATELKPTESESFTCEHVLAESDVGVYTNVAAIEGNGKEKTSGKVEAEVGTRQVVAFGKNHFGQLGAGFVTHSTAGFQFETSPVAGPPPSGAEPSEIVEVAQGFKFGVGRLRNGRVETWGRDEKGELGYDVAPESQPPNEQWGNDGPLVVPGVEGAVQVAAAGLHGMALLRNGSIMTWGNSEGGEDGNGTAGLEGWDQDELTKGRVPDKEEREEKAEHLIQRPEPKPVNLPLGTTATAIAAGGQDDYALLSNGEVVAWGSAGNGVLTISESREAEKAEKEACGSGAPEKGEERSVAFERWYKGHHATPTSSCAYLCFEESGGVQPCDPEPHYIEVNGEEKLGNVSKIAASEESAYAIKEGKLYGWGNDQEGQLGTGAPSRAIVSSPVQVKEFGSAAIAELAAGSGAESSAGQFVLARLTNGQVFGWGDDGKRQLGMAPVCRPGNTCSACANSSECVPTPTEIPNLSGLGTVERISAGGKDSFVLVGGSNFKGRLYGWGENGCGQLGIGTTEGECEGSEGDTEVPTRVNAGYEFTQVSASEFETSGVIAPRTKTEVTPTFAASASVKEGTVTVTVTWNLAESGREYTLRLCEQETLVRCERGPEAGSPLPKEKKISADPGTWQFTGVPLNESCHPPTPGFVANLGGSELGEALRNELTPCYEILLETEVEGEMRRRIISDFATGA